MSISDHFPKCAGKPEGTAAQPLELRSAALFSGVRIALRIADELGVSPKDHLARDVIVATVVTARANGSDSHIDLTELARMSAAAVSPLRK